jgi:pimeloyl-ACP methyl ester carboxylesterase
MPQPTPFFRSTGQGPCVVCFHSNASHVGQWRPLADRVADRHQVVAVDSYASGKSPDWPQGSAGSLAEEVAFVRPLLDALPGPLVLAGHSYGGAVAVKAALALGARCAALALYEPTLFALVERQEPKRVDGIRHAADAAADHVARGAPADGARCFIDFWMGAGSWDAMPEARKPAIAQATRNVGRWKNALFTDDVDDAELRALDMPVLLLTGAASPESSRSVAQRLLQLLPRARHEELPGLGHMAPVTHPEVVNARIEEFLGTVAR